ncbi:MAG: hypothetical protein LAN59_01420 [Acidobacteriia bacterium]|nr:hypothetical protein [Terriglobia bacterium]
MDCNAAGEKILAEMLSNGGCDPEELGFVAAGPAKWDRADAASANSPARLYQFIL